MCDAMIAIVNSYFDGFTSHDGEVVLAHQGCNRYENGTRVTGTRAPRAELAAMRGQLSAGGRRGSGSFAVSFLAEAGADAAMDRRPR